MVSIVGAGPGDPELITVRALRLVQSSDVILFDRLVGEEVLREARSECVLIDVGKRAHDSRSTKQEWINEQLIYLAQRLPNVVRLKGGDPFVFGRGSEEAIALAEAGIEFQVVPGISSAIAAAESALIPVTHRGVSASFGVFSAHGAGNEESAVDWSVAARISTAVFLMGVERLPTIVQNLINHGRAPETPVAIISSATLPNQKEIYGTLCTILNQSGAAKSPAVVVVGDVVDLAFLMSIASIRAAG